MFTEAEDTDNMLSVLEATSNNSAAASAAAFAAYASCGNLGLSYSQIKMQADRTF